jgi:hypothetical protein
MIMGGMNRYLTKAQSMPKQVESLITARVQTFIWGNIKVPPISISALQQHPTAGDIKLLDLPARNDTIELTWLAAYLKQGAGRPAWAYIAVRSFARNVLVTDKHIVPEEAKVNMFTQAWTTSTHLKSSTPMCLKRMMSVTAKYNATLTAVKQNGPLRAGLPIWHHIGCSVLDCKKLHNKEGRYLIKRH